MNWLFVRVFFSLQFSCGWWIHTHWSLEGIKSKALIDCASEEESISNVVCKDEVKKKLLFNLLFDTLCHAMTQRQVVNIQMKMSSSSSSFIDSLKPKLFASKTFYYVYGFYVISFVKSHLIFRLPLYFIQFNLIFCTFFYPTHVGIHVHVHGNAMTMSKRKNSHLKWTNSIS